eukprot:g6216.t1
MQVVLQSTLQAAEKMSVTLTAEQLRKFEHRAAQTDKRIEQLERQFAQLRSSGGGDAVTEVYKKNLLTKLHAALSLAEEGLAEVRQQGGSGVGQGNKGKSTLETDNEKLRKEVRALQAKVQVLENAQKNPDVIPRRQPLNAEDL